MFKKKPSEVLQNLISAALYLDAKFFSVLNSSGTGSLRPLDFLW